MTPGSPTLVSRLATVATAERGLARVNSCGAPAQADAAPRRVAHGVGEVAQVALGPAEHPDDGRVALPERPMPRTFAYLHVSTPGQTTDNQLAEITAAGFAIEPRRVVAETVSGSVAAVQRRGFARLLDRLEAEDVLVVTKLDRLGRNAIDVGATVARFADLGVRVHCLALGGRNAGDVPATREGKA